MAQAKQDMLIRFLTDKAVRAVSAGDVDALKECLQKGASIHARNQAGDPLIVISMHQWMEEMPQFLLDKGADINAPDQQGMTALMHAVARVDIQKIDILLQNKADVNLADSLGKTALMHVFKKTNTNHYGAEEPKILQIIKKLVDANADILAVDNKGQGMPDLIMQIDATDRDKKNARDQIEAYFMSRLPNTGPILPAVNPHIANDVEGAPMPELKKKPFAPAGGPASATGGP